MGRIHREMLNVCSALPHRPYHAGTVTCRKHLSSVTIKAVNLRMVKFGLEVAPGAGGNGRYHLTTRETSNSVSCEGSREDTCEIGEFLLGQKERKAAQRCVNPGRSKWRGGEIQFPSLFENPSEPLK